MDGFCAVELVGVVKSMERKEGKTFALLRIESTQPVRGAVATEQHDCILPGDVRLRGAEVAVDSIVHVRGPLKTVSRIAPESLGLPEGTLIPSKEIVILEGIVLGRHFPDVPF